MITADISWDPNYSNVGSRVVRIVYKPLVGAPVVAKETITQCDPDVSIATTQEASIVLGMSIGDQAWVVVRQDSPVTIRISMGNNTSLSGLQSIAA